MRLLIGVGLGTPSEISAYLPAVFNGLSGPVLNKRSLNLRETHQESNDKECHQPQRLRVNQTIEGLDMDSLLLEVIQMIDDLNLGPTKAITFATTNWSYSRSMERQARS